MSDGVKDQLLEQEMPLCCYHLGNYKGFGVLCQELGTETTIFCHLTIWNQVGLIAEWRRQKSGNMKIDKQITWSEEQKENIEEKRGKGLGTHGDTIKRFGLYVIGILHEKAWDREKIWKNCG